MAYRNEGEREFFPSLIRGLFSDAERGLPTISTLASAWNESTAFPIDVEETTDSYVVSANLPGVKKEEVEVAMENGRLTLAVTQTKESEQKNGRRYLYRERSTKAHSRVLTLPHASSDCKAALNEGVLTVTVKKEDEKKTKRISID